MATYASQPHLPQGNAPFNPGMGTGLNRFASLSQFGLGSKLPPMKPNPVASPQGPQTTPATAQGIMQTMKQALLEGEAQAEGAFGARPGALVRRNSPGSALYPSAERGNGSGTCGWLGKSAASEGISFFLSAGNTHEGRFSLITPNYPFLQKRAMGEGGMMPPAAPPPPTGAAPAVAPPPTGGPPPQGPGAPGATPGAMASMAMQQPGGGAPMQGQPMQGPPATLDGQVPPMGMPPTPPLPANPRMNPPRLADQHDFTRRRQLNDLLAMDAQSDPANMGDATADMESDIMALGGKVAHWTHGLFHKRALHVEQGGGLSRLGADTIGRVQGLPMLMLTGKALNTPNEQKHQELGKRFDGAADGALKDTVLRLGGTNIVDDLLWKKQRGDEQLKWHQRVGGRVWHNDKSGIIGKLLGTVSTPMTNLQTSLSRAPHYNPFTDVAHQFTDEPAVAEHELGHAYDFNSLYGLKPGESKHTGVKGFLARQGKGLARDAYGLAYGLPLANLWHEGAANFNAVKLHQKSKHLMPEDEAREHELRQLETLPASYGSYLGSNLDVSGTGLGSLVGMGVGKAYGLLHGQSIREQDRHAKKKEEQPRDGDHDGKVRDGTKDEAPVAKAASFSNLNLKFAYQEPDGSHQPARSTTGESKGLKFAPSYDGRGQEAWESVSEYFKGHSKRKTQPNPFLGKHAEVDYTRILDSLGMALLPNGKLQDTARLRHSGTTKVAMNDWYAEGGDRKPTDYGERLRRLAARRHPGTEEEALAALDAEFTRLALPQEEFDKTAFDHKDLETLATHGVNRKKNGTLIGSNRVNTTQPLQHSQRVKEASTALVRAIRNGLLSPKAVSQAAGAMAPGKFRFVNNLGRGQFNLADRVVGNVGGQAGEMVRKIPTRQVSSAAGSMESLKGVIDTLNKRFGPGLFQRAMAKLTGNKIAPQIAPYLHVGQQGAFQAMANGAPQINPALKAGLGDLHRGNIGPNGQILDFSIKKPEQLGLGKLDPTRGNSSQFKDQFIDPVSDIGGDKLDVFGNVNNANMSSVAQNAVERALPQSNNIVRKYWATPQPQRPQMMQQVNRGAGTRRHSILSEMLPQRAGATPGRSGSPTPPKAPMQQPAPQPIPPTGSITPPTQNMPTPQNVRPPMGNFAPTHDFAMGQTMNDFAKAAADMSPFARGFFAHCTALQLNDGQIKVAIDRAEAKFGPEVRGELEAGHTKLAGIGGKVMNWLNTPRTGGLQKGLMMGGAAAGAGATGYGAYRGLQSLNEPASQMGAQAQSLGQQTMDGIGDKLQPLIEEGLNEVPQWVERLRKSPIIQEGQIAGEADAASHGLGKPPAPTSATEAPWKGHLRDAAVPLGLAAFTGASMYGIHRLNKFFTDRNKQKQQEKTAAPKSPWGQIGTNAFNAYGKPFLSSLWGGTKQVVQSAPVRQSLTRSGTGALVGGFSGPSDPLNNYQVGIGPMQVEFSPHRALAGAVAFNPHVRRAVGGSNPALRSVAKPILNSAQRGLTGGMVGNAIDDGLGLAGVDTQGMGQQIGQWGGAASGGVQPLMSNAVRRATGTAAQAAQTARTPFQTGMRNMAAGGMRAGKQVHQNIHDFGTQMDDVITHAPGWVGRKLFQGGSQPFFAAPSRNAGGRAGRFVGGTALGATGIGFAANAASDYVNNKATQLVNHQLQNTVDPYINDRVQQMSDQAHGIYDSLHQRAMKDGPQIAQNAIQGSNPFAALFGGGGEGGGGFDMSTIMQYGDKAISMMGLDPARMNGLQKVMLLGGILSGGMGLLGGSNTMMGLGGASAGLSLLPYFLQSQQGQQLMGRAQDGFSRLTNGQQPSQAPQAPGQGGQPAVNQPQARNEFQYQQTMQNGGQQPSGQQQPPPQVFGQPQMY